MSTMGLLRVASWFFKWLYQHNREKVCTLTQWYDTVWRVCETEIRLGSGDLVMRGEGVRHPPTSVLPRWPPLFKKLLSKCVCVWVNVLLFGSSARLRSHLYTQGLKLCKNLVFSKIWQWCFIKEIFQTLMLNSNWDLLHFHFIKCSAGLILFYRCEASVRK